MIFKLLLHFFSANITYGFDSSYIRVGAHIFFMTPHCPPGGAMGGNGHCGHNFVNR